MSTIKKLIAGLQKAHNESYTTLTELGSYANNVMEQKPGLRLPGDKRAAVDFIISEFERMQKDLPEMKTFRDADALCQYASELLSLLKRFIPSRDKLDAQKCAVVDAMGAAYEKTEALPAAVDRLFQSMDGSEINVSEVLPVIDMVKPLTDQYHRNTLLVGLLHYKDKLPRLTFDAEAVLQDYVGDEMERLAAKWDDMTEDESTGLELAADLCRYIPCDRLTGILSRLSSLGMNNINFYALSSMISLKQEVSDELIHQLAFDDEYTSLTKSELDKAGMGDRFPANRTDPKILHMSDLVHWLVWPTELGKKPDAIKFYCTVDAPDGTTYVYLFKSDSDTLSDDLKNEWLIGWSDDENGSFSQFRPLSSCDQGTPEKTMAYIKSCLQ